MKMLRRKVLGPITLLHLIVLGAFIVTVSGTAMLYYAWEIDLTWQFTDVTFYRWSDVATAGALTLDYNYYTDVITEDRNATWGIWNRGASNKTVYLWAEFPLFPDNIDYFYAGILDESGTIITWWTTMDWSNIGELNAVSWNAIAGTKYTLHLIMKGASSAGGFEYIVLRLKTDP